MSKTKYCIHSLEKNGYNQCSDSELRAVSMKNRGISPMGITLGVTKTNKKIATEITDIFFFLSL